MHGLGDVFGELFARAGRPATPGSRKDGHVVDLIKELPAPEQKEEQQQSAQQPLADQQQPPLANPEKERLLRIFNLNGQTLELADNRLKARSARDYYTRLTYLVLYAREILLGQSSTARSDLDVVLKAAKVYDANCRFWLKQRNGFTIVEEDRMKLNASGREQAVLSVNAALDANVQDTWNPDKKMTKPRGATKKKKA